MVNVEFEVIKKDKNELEVKIDNLTIVELLRVYLNKDSSVTFAAWKKEHSSENPILKVQTKGKTAKKAIDDAISLVIKDLEKVEKDFKGMK